ncbi:MAG TPA: ORF6N domain-containing protein [Pyrinomonadaceae bacterium]|nr:ORF6N domain-containing protein [Pyrinomonadaceae bacterium]
MPNTSIALPDELIEDTILLTRGKRVILDHDLARLYGVPTKVLNQAVKRNTDRFPEDFMFQLTKAETDPRGDYFIIGRKPKEFREFDCIELAVEYDDDGKVSGRAMISTYDNDQYGSIYGISGVVTEQRISLVAKPVSDEDVGYHFEGEFLRHGELWRAGRSQPVLKGRLSKIKGGKTIAEAVVKFRIEYLGC